MNQVEQISTPIISRRDFLKLKSFLLLWYYFLQSFGINLLSNSPQKIDYSLLDKLQQLPFSDEVIDELTLRVNLQKKYSTDANGKLHSLNRFIREMTNYIISKKDFGDFKLLSSIKDEQMDYSYMFICTARHNEKRSMKYLQRKLIAINDDAMLNRALEYAIKSKSVDTTLHLMQQKIHLDDKSQQYLLSILHSEEYTAFHKKISGNQYMSLPNYSVKKRLKKREIAKKTFSIDENYMWDGSHIYEYLYTTVHNSLVDLYRQCIVEDFIVKLIGAKAHVEIFATSYPLNFLERFELALHKNGFTTWSEDMLYLCSTKSHLQFEYQNDIQDSINKLLYSNTINTDEFINIEML